MAERLKFFHCDDDPDDRDLVREALIESGLDIEIEWFGSGEEILQRLRSLGSAGATPSPCVILLDLNMPRTSGSQVLATLKADPVLKRLPMVILTTSRDRRDVARSYDLGAAGRPGNRWASTSWSR